MIARRSPALALTPDNYRADPLFPRVERAVLALAVSKNVAPVDVFVRIGTLRAEDLEAWRRGQIPFLERAIQGSLSKLSRVLRILGFFCHELNLVASSQAYVRQGKGPKTQLRFTKTGEPRLERLYARHFVWPGKVDFHLPAPKKS